MLVQMLDTLGGIVAQPQRACDLRPARTACLHKLIANIAHARKLQHLSGACQQAAFRQGLTGGIFDRFNDAAPIDDFGRLLGGNIIAPVNLKHAGGIAGTAGVFEEQGLIQAA